MSNALLSDVEARAERRRTRTRDEQCQALARAAWVAGQDAAAAREWAQARRWLDRARRLLPRDGTIAMGLATVLLQAGEAQAAAGLFQELAERFGGGEAWTGLAASALQAGQMERAREAVAAALRCSVPNPALIAVAAQVVQRLGLVGWCGLDGEGRVRAGPGRATRILLDGAVVTGTALPQGWWGGDSLVVLGRGGADLLGSPIPVRAIGAVEGFVEARDGGISGWAWHPADPGRDPMVLVQGRAMGAMLPLREAAEGVTFLRPMARPRRIVVTANRVRALGGVRAVTDQHGRQLLGSPIDPEAVIRPVWADTRGFGPASRAAGPAVDVVIPVHRGTRETLACIDAVLGSRLADTVVHVVEDASPEPGLVAALQRLAAEGRIRLTRLAENRGFPAAANAGLRAAAGRDVVLLNSDTLVSPGWLERLRAAAYAAADIGSATPLSNEATILSYPDRRAGNAVPDLAGTMRLDAVAQAANGAGTVEIPVGVGFCLYLRRDCLDQVGVLREDVFAQGYGEENDWCLRARHLGWRHVAATGVFVAHVGGRSFGRARDHLMRRNAGLLEAMYPGYDALIAAHGAADPLRGARRAMDALRWAEGRQQGAVILVTHAGGGGVDRVVDGRCAALAADGRRAVVLRPGPGGSCQVGTPGGAFPNLVYAVPEELPALAALLRDDRPSHLEQHHLLGHSHGVLGLAGLLGIPTDIHVHDYALLCQRVALVSTERRYCGEPELDGCEACIADLGSLLEEEITMPALLARSAADLAAARRVVVPSQDVAARVRRHFPAIRPVVAPWEDDGALPAPAPIPSGDLVRVCVVGAIGVEKGFEVLLGCARDARRRGLALEFVVCGFTMDDARLMAAGPVFVTGEYQEAEAVALIRAQEAQLGFIPSVWPETWCFALSRAWEAGLRVAAFDLGAQAERIRRTGRGWTLPLGLQPRAVNDALLSLARAGMAQHSPGLQRERA